LMHGRNDQRTLPNGSATYVGGGRGQRYRREWRSRRRRNAYAVTKALEYRQPGAPPPPPPELLGVPPLDEELDEELLLELEEEDELLELLDEDEEELLDDELDEELLELEELVPLVGVTEASLDSALVPALFIAATL